MDTPLCPMATGRHERVGHSMGQRNQLQTPFEMTGADMDRVCAAIRGRPQGPGRAARAFDMLELPRSTRLPCCPASCRPLPGRVEHPHLMPMAATCPTACATRAGGCCRPCAAVWPCRKAAIRAQNLGATDWVGDEGVDPVQRPAWTICKKPSTPAGSRPDRRVGGPKHAQGAARLWPQCSKDTVIPTASATRGTWRP